MSSTANKIIITGTGRAGTTFLVQLLTELGLDTGYTPANWQRDFHSHCVAGLERDPADPKSPRIIKSPDFCETLSSLLAANRIAVEHALIPIRHLADAAQSRIRIGGKGEVPGGLLGTAVPTDQPSVLAQRFHQLLRTLATHDIPHTLLDFPRFVREADYTWAKLAPIFPAIDHSAFASAFARLAHPELIHDFASIEKSGEPARHFLSVQRMRRLRRRLARVLGGIAVAVAAWFLSAWWHAS